MDCITYADQQFAIHHEEGTPVVPRLADFVGLEELFSLIAANSYRSVDTRLSALDAITPFQVMTRLWCSAGTSIQIHRLHHEPVRIIYAGSWYGQQLALDLVSKVNDDRVISADLVDIDSQAISISEYVVGHYVSHPNLSDVVFNCRDVLTYHRDSPYPHVLVVSGAEHYDRDKLKQWITDESCRIVQPAVILLGTDMKAPDHVYSYSHYTSLRSLLPSTYTVDYGGQMRTALGSRFMVVAH